MAQSAPPVRAFGMNPLRVCAALVCLALVTACASAPKVSVDHNPSFDFASKTRFAVLRPEMAMAALGGGGAPVMNDLMARRLTNAIERELGSRGFALVPPDQADLLVTFFVTTDNRTDVRTYNTGFRYGRCWDPYRCAGWASPEISVQQYTVGTLFVDFVDPASKTLQWRGTTSHRLPSNPSQEKRDALVNEVVHAIIEQFPPGRTPVQ